MTTLMLAGLGVAVSALAARFVVQTFRQMRASKLPTTSAFTAYYRGGFEPKMNRREAGLILGDSLFLSSLSLSLITFPLQESAHLLPGSASKMYTSGSCCSTTPIKEDHPTSPLRLTRPKTILKTLRNLTDEILLQYCSVRYLSDYSVRILYQQNYDVDNNK